MQTTNTIPVSNNAAKSYKPNSCDGFGCVKDAIKKVNVNAGTFGNISVNLCIACARLFEN